MAKICIDRFEVSKQLGEGFQGKVYLAWDPQLERKVALKVVNVEKADVNASLDIIHEARIAARVAHPNVIPIHEVGLFQNTPLLVFEYVDGVTLRDHLGEHRRLDEQDALSVMVRLAAGLSCAHEQGIVHLDISPRNIMIDKSGRPRIMDFGLARVSGEKKQKAGKVFGTPRYLTPEHLSRGELNATTDIFSLGLVFYELLTGVAVFNQPEVSEVYSAIERGDIDWGKLQYLGLSAEVIAVVRDMLQLKQDWRYQNAQDLITALDTVIAIQQNEDRGALALDFLLRRLERRPEFPACSHSIGEINRLTEENSNTDFNKLGAVIVRDYSLTNRVLKIANSVIFDRQGEGVKTISVAISRLGLKLVRMICNGLLLFKQVENKNSELRDILVASFVAALLARHVCSNSNRRLAEEAFICALFHKLGNHLLVFYLPDEHEDILARMQKGEARHLAERAILSTSCATLGAAVARKWHFPETIIRCMHQLPPGELAAPQTDADVLSHLANYANELCLLFATHAEGTALLDEVEIFSRRHAQIFDFSPQHLAQLASAVAGKFADLAPGLGINYHDSHFCQRLDNFADVLTAAEQLVAEARPLNTAHSPA